MKTMKNVALFLLISGIFYMAACQKDKTSDNFKNLTGVTWRSDSLLVNGTDAGSGLLKNFVGDVKFNEDGTGTFGKYKGSWAFAFNETELIITSDSLPIPLTTRIVELTKSSLKVTTTFPDPQNFTNMLNLRMTFKPK